MSGTGERREGREGRGARDARVRATYDAVAASYAEHVGGELAGKPFDRWLLTRLATETDGPVLDAGCGPGHVTRFLADAGADVVGLDLSPGMVAQARASYTDLRFEPGDLTRPPSAPPTREEGWALVVAWYSLVHLPHPDLGEAVGALAEVVRPGGRLALATHVGDEVRHTEDLWGHAVDVDFVLHDPTVVRRAVAAAGLTGVEWYVRGSYDGVEVATDRVYVVATKP